jgi:peptide/nickel transport system ATP-binding protein
VSVQAQVLNLLEDLKRDLGLTMLFISHDLAVVKHVSDRVAVMYLGRLCEIADAETLYRGSVHPYTRTLLSAVPEPDPEAPPHALSLIPGELPSPVNPPSGCPFRTRCPRASDLCASQMPQLQDISPGHLSACHHPLT